MTYSALTTHSRIRENSGLSIALRAFPSLRSRLCIPRTSSAIYVIMARHLTIRVARTGSHALLSSGLRPWSPIPQNRVGMRNQLTQCRGLLAIARLFQSRPTTWVAALAVAAASAMTSAPARPITITQSKYPAVVRHSKSEHRSRPVSAHQSMRIKQRFAQVWNVRGQSTGNDGAILHPAGGSGRAGSTGPTDSTGSTESIGTGPSGPSQPTGPEGPADPTESASTAGISVDSAIHSSNKFIGLVLRSGVTLIRDPRYSSDGQWHDISKVPGYPSGVHAVSIVSDGSEVDVTVRTTRGKVFAASCNVESAAADPNAWLNSCGTGFKEVSP